MVRSRCEEAAHGEVLVKLGPVDADTSTHQPIVRTFGGTGVTKPREPLEGDADLSTILEVHDKPVVGEVERCGAGALRNHGAFSMLPQKWRRAPA